MQRLAELGAVADTRGLDVVDVHLAPARAGPGLERGEVTRPGVVVGGQRPARAGRGHVELLGVVAHHPAGPHLGAEGRDGVQHHREPVLRQAVLVGVVEARGHLVLDDVVERVGLDVVAALRVLDPVGGRDGPAVLAVEPLVPPAVEDGEVERPVERGLHARGAAGLERAQRVVEPDVAARVEVQRHRDVVVGQEDDAVAHLGVVGELHQLLDQLLAGLVGGVRLAGDDELDRPLGVEQQLLEPLGVAQHEGEPLVGGHPAGEPDGEHVGVEDLVGPAELGRRGAPLEPRLAGAAARLVDELGAHRALGGPHGIPGNGGERLPRLLGVELVHVGVGAGQLEDAAVDPGGAVHAVGDGGDRHLVVVEARPEPVEHLAAHDAVQLGDAVGALREPQAHDRHVEDAGRPALVGLGPELQQPLDRDALEGLGAPEVELDERGVEAVDAGGHRGVGGEHGGAAHGLEGLVEGHAVRPHELADPLDTEEAGVALVGVVDVGHRGAGDLRPQPQRPHAAHAEQHLLLQAQLAAAAVQALGDDAGRLVVLVHVGVEEQQRHPAHLGAPDVGVQLAATGQLDGDAGGRAVLVAQQRQGQPVGVEDGVVLLLPAVAVQALAEVAGLVEQADPDDRDPDVGGRLEVVAGEDAEATGVLRQGGGDAELGAEVGDRRGHVLRLLAAPLLVPAVLADVPVERLLGGVDPLDEGRVGGEPLELLRRDRRQHGDRVLADRGPAGGVDGLEEVAQRRVPAPPQVHGEVAERGDACGQDGADAEATDGLHEGPS